MDKHHRDAATLSFALAHGECFVAHPRVVFQLYKPNCQQYSFFIQDQKFREIKSSSNKLPREQFVILAFIRPIIKKYLHILLYSRKMSF